jgi:hypothetical protein
MLIKNFLRISFNIMDSNIKIKKKLSALAHYVIIDHGFICFVARKGKWSNLKMLNWSWNIQMVIYLLVLDMILVQINFL